MGNESLWRREEEGYVGEGLEMKRWKGGEKKKEKGGENHIQQKKSSTDVANCFSPPPLPPSPLYPVILNTVLMNKMYRPLG